MEEVTAQKRFSASLGSLKSPAKKRPRSRLKRVNRAEASRLPSPLTSAKEADIIHLDDSDTPNAQMPPELAVEVEKDGMPSAIAVNMTDLSHQPAVGGDNSTEDVRTEANALDEIVGASKEAHKDELRRNNRQSPSLQAKSAGPNAEVGQANHNSPAKKTTNVPAYLQDPMQSYQVQALQFVVNEALLHHSHLLSKAEIAVAESLVRGLSDPAVYLFCRLYGRKHDQWLPRAELQEKYGASLAKFGASSSVKDVSGELEKLGLLIATDAQDNLAATALAILPTLVLDQAKEVYRMVPGVKKVSNKKVIMEKLTEILNALLEKPASLPTPSAISLQPTSLKFSSVSLASRISPRKTWTKLAVKAPPQKPTKKLSQGTLTATPPGVRIARAIIKKAGPAVRITEDSLSALRRIFFVVLLDDEAHKDHTFTLAFTSKVRYPGYEVKRETKLFELPQALYAFEEARELERRMDEVLHVKANLRDHDAAIQYGDIADARIRITMDLAPGNMDTDGDELKLEFPNLFEYNEDIQNQHPFLRRYTPHWVCVRIAWYSVAALEAKKMYAEAVDRLELLLNTRIIPKRRGKILERLTINLKHLKKPKAALKHIVAALNESNGDLRPGDRHNLAKRAAKLHEHIGFNGIPKTKLTKKEREEIEKKVTDTMPKCVKVAEANLAREIPIVNFQRTPVNKDEGNTVRMDTRKQTRIFGSTRQDDNATDVERRGVRVWYESMQGDGVQVTVEELALEYYRERGWEGCHDEGGTIRFLFALLMWESAIFAPVADVFHTKFQDRPLDLHTEAFYSTRKNAIENRLTYLRNLDAVHLKSEVLSLYEKYLGIQAVGCNWGKYSSEELARVACGFGAEGIVLICRLLSSDYSYWGAGIADLVLWKVSEQGGEARAKLVEVKSANDTLMGRQRAWLCELLDSGVDCEIFSVSDV